MSPALPSSLLFFLLLVLPGPALASSPAAIKIQNACHATRSPALCVASLAESLNRLPPDPVPQNIVRAAIAVVLGGIEAAKPKALAVLNSPAPPNATRANVAKNCLQGLSYARNRLNAASRSLEPEPALADARAWASAAVHYHHGCWSGLKIVNDTHEVADAIGTLATLTNLTSNALSMVAALQRYGGDTRDWAPLKTEREGYWGTDGAGRAWKAGGGVPAGLAANATVCKEGCQYRTVQSAVDAAPLTAAGDGRRFVIRIKQGVYEETVRVGFKRRNVVFVGDGMGKTVITGSLNVGMPGVSTYNTATVGVNGDGFMAANLTISNTAGPDAHQAVAFRSDSDRSVLERVELAGHQDTLYARALRQLYKSCLISGTVDFIFGDSAAVFLDSTLLVVPRQLSPEAGDVNAVTAHARVDPAQSTGFVFRGCVVNGSEEYVAYYCRRPEAHRSYLGRPWREYSRTVFIECYMGEIVRPEGWMVWSGDFALNTLFYGEFGNKGPGANTTARVTWSSQIPAKYVDVYSTRNFIQMG